MQLVDLVHQPLAIFELLFEGVRFLGHDVVLKNEVKVLEFYQNPFISQVKC